MTRRRGQNPRTAGLRPRAHDSKLNYPCRERNSETRKVLCLTLLLSARSNDDGAAGACAEPPAGRIRRAVRGGDDLCRSAPCGFLCRHLRRIGGVVEPFFDELVVAAVLPHRSEQVVELIEDRSEEHTSELQSRGHLVCRLLLEKKNNH